MSVVCDAILDRKITRNTHEMRRVIEGDDFCDAD